MTEYLKSQSYVVIANTLFLRLFELRVVILILRCGIILRFGACNALFKRPQKVVFDITALMLQRPSQTISQLHFVPSWRHDRKLRQSRCFFTLWCYHQRATAGLLNVILYS